MLRTTAVAALLAALAAPALGDDEPYLKDPRQLTHDADYSRAGEAYYSPDGRRILFQAVAQAHPYYQIYVMDVDGSDQRMVSTGQGKTTCAYFKPGAPDRFQYASSHLDPRTHAPPAPGQGGRSYQWDYDGSFDIFEADVTTGEIVRRLTEADGYDAEGSYSHDGKKICFTSRRKDGDSDIWLMDADGSNQRPLVQVRGTDGGPFFSPDDRWVLYRAARDPGDSIMHVYLTSVAGEGTRQLTTVDRINWAPYFHPSGVVVAYAANVSGHEFEVILVKADGSGRELRLTRTEGFDGLPVFSPDGKKLLWTSSRAGGAPQVWEADFVMPPDEAFAVPTPPAADPHGGPGASGSGSNPHGSGSSNPHGSGDANPHGSGSNPHGASSPHGSGDADPHGGGEAHPHGGGAKPHGSGSSDSGGLIEPRRAGVALAGLEELRADGLRADVAWLADDAREGRRADTRGSRAAAAWLAYRFAELGLEPAGPHGSYWQPFSFSKGSRRAAQGNALTVAGSAWILDTDYAPLLYSSSGQVEGGLVFAGYGITAPEHGHDDLAGVDLEGKVAVVLTGGPRAGQGGAFGAESPTVYDDLRYKVGNVRDAGAAAVVLVRSSGEGWLRLSSGDPGLPVVQVRPAALARVGLDVAQLGEAIEAHGPASRVVDARVRLSVAVERVQGRSQNVLARVRGTHRPDEVVVVGAHYDHLGWGGEGSLSPDAEAIHNGADDNASGTAALLALARAFQRHPPRRTILFAAFGAEEQGLIGSRHFVEQPVVPLERVVAMINMDMIGRLEGRPLVVGGAGTAAEWGDLLQAAADAAGQPIKPQADGMGPSDHASFYGAGVPVLFLFSGNHRDYHKPSDDTWRVDFEGAARAARVAYALARGIDGLEERPAFVKVERADRPKRVVTGEAGAYFGSIPDYAQGDDVQGVLLSGARAGTPADAAGIQPGDVVVEFAGRRIQTIHDYVNALRLARPGQEVDVVVLRQGQRVRLEATLGGR